MYRHSKNKSEIVILHWQKALDAINSAEELISHKTELNVNSLINIISLARTSLESEDPLEAIKIASSISGHLDSLESTTSDAKQAIDDAEKSLSSIEGSISVMTKERLEESKLALIGGDSSLAKGLATSIIRDIKLTSESMQNVQRGLRQKNKLIESFPKGLSGDIFRSKLKDIENKVTSDDWLDASDILSELTNDLQSYEKSLSEALELYSFIESEWNDLRRKLDSANIKVNDEMRIDAELNVSQCKTFLDDGDIDSTLVALGRTDEIIENLRRRI